MAKKLKLRKSNLSFYIAGSFSQKDKIKKLMKEVVKMGGTISSDWTTHPSIFPYSENSDTAKKFAVEDLDGARNCRFFIMFPEQEGGSTQFAELGAAIFSDKVERVFVVGKNNSRSLSFFHSRVDRLASFNEVLKAVGLVKKSK